MDLSSEDGKKKKRKGRCGGVKTTKSKELSKCWLYFRKIMVPSVDDPNVEEMKARCRYCANLLTYKQGSSTSHLLRHKRSCTAIKANLQRLSVQSRLGFQPISASSGLPLQVPTNGFDQATVKELIAKMIAAHDYSFRMVEHEWFNALMKYMNPLYKQIGRKAIRAECLRVYKDEKEMLKAELKHVAYISLATNLWTSNQSISYICVVAHYIDKDWKMQTRVLSFTELDPPHTGHVIADAVFVCVAEWKLEKKIISITLDNASNSDGAVRDLMAMFDVRRGTSFDAKYFHVRCCAHIINLVVQDGTAYMTNLVSNLREIIKYFKKSLARLHKFTEICRVLGLEIGKHLCLDVCTRWSSTYKMINVAYPYRQAMKSYAISDANYKWEPSKQEWNLFKLIEPLLYAFACVATSFSTTSYPTSNIFYPHIVSIKKELRKAMVHQNQLYNDMGHKMMEKFNKYWEDTSNVMVIATFLDPRYKMKYVQWCFQQIYDEDKGKTELKDFKMELETLYEKFDAQIKQTSQRAGVSTSNASSMASSSMPPADSEFAAFLSATSAQPSKSSLRKTIWMMQMNQ